jgi:hypothetical protein
MSFLPSEEFFQLLKPPISKKKIGDTVAFTAISSTGLKAAILTYKKFWVFNTTPPSVVCGGEFVNKTLFKYESTTRPLDSQHPTPERFKVKDFLSVAVSDSFLAIGAPERVMVFTLIGKDAGRWVVCDTMKDDYAGVEKLKFSREGKQLLALLRVETGGSNEIKAKIYDTGGFPKEQLDRVKPLTVVPGVAEVKWDWDLMHTPCAAAFSREGTMIAICTTHSGFQAQIRLLKKFNPVWRLWGVQGVRVFPDVDQRNWVGEGLTGISLYLTFNPRLI